MREIIRWGVNRGKGIYKSLCVSVYIIYDTISFVCGMSVKERGKITW